MSNLNFDIQLFADLTLDGTTLIVGSEQTDSVVMQSYTDLANVIVLDASANSHDILLGGNSQNNQILAGEGQQALWGAGTGANTLTGGSARNLFFYGGGSKDFVTNFTTGIEDNSDVVVITGEIANIRRSSSTVALNTSDGNYMRLFTGSSSSDDLIMYSMDGRIANAARIAETSATSINYSQNVNYFQLVLQGEVVVSDENFNSVWLGGEAGQTFSGIETINASAATGGNILVGNVDSNMIIGGKGDTSMWGGSGNASDILTGGEGTVMFWYGQNDGNDEINGAKSNDTVFLYDVSLDNISSVDTSTAGNLTIGFNTGSTLTTKFSGGITPAFQLQDGSRYAYNRSTNSWQDA